jgi:hypothetical protein
MMEFMNNIRPVKNHDMNRIAAIAACSLHNAAGMQGCTLFVSFTAGP